MFHDPDPLSPRDQFRDNSGDFACPGCKGRLAPMTEVCAGCGNRLDWSEAMLLSELRRITYEMHQALGDRRHVSSATTPEIAAFVSGEQVLAWALSLCLIEEVRTNRP